MSITSLQLHVFLPGDMLIDQTISRLTAEATDGTWCLLPRHMDFVTALVPGILTFHDMDGGEHFVAHDEGLLVKCAETLSITTQDAVYGRDLDKLRATVTQQYIDLDEHQRQARTALARLEAGAIRRFIELERSAHD